MNVFEIVTNRVIEALNKGVIPWQQPWKGNAKPTNFLTNKAYRGINVLMLWPGEFTSPYWLTFRQAILKGGHVRKGAKGTPIVFYKPVEKDIEEAEQNGNGRFVLRYSTVFNVEQCEGLEIPAPETIDTLPEISPIERCEQIIANWTGRPTLNLENPDQEAAFYRPSTDTIYMPIRNRFVSAEHFYSTLWHEATHSTGHSSRLDRDMSGVSGDRSYSREELIAEMGAAFLCAVTGISNERTETNTTAYIQSWIKVFRNDSRVLVQAASQAQKAVDMIVGSVQAQEEDSGPEAAA